MTGGALLYIKERSEKMYTILVNSDDTLTTSVRERIIQGSTMVNKLRFLVEPEYNGYDMRLFTAMLEYVSNRKYVPEKLTPSDELYKGMIEYTLPIDTKLTYNSGEVEVALKFIYLEMDENGNFVEHIRPTESTIINVIPANQWSSYIAGADLDNLAQIMLSTQAMTEQALVTAQYNNKTKADNIKYDKDNNELWLESNGKKIGNTVTELPKNDCRCENGVPVVDFSNATDFVTPDDTIDDGTDLDNVVEFDPYAAEDVDNVVEF